MDKCFVKTDQRWVDAEKQPSELATNPKDLTAYAQQSTAFTPIRVSSTWNEDDVRIFLLHSSLHARIFLTMADDTIVNAVVCRLTSILTFLQSTFQPI